MRLVTFLLLWSSSWLTGQQYHFKEQPHFPDADISQVRAIFQSSDQMIWMGTDAGVFAFDGRTYTIIPRPDGGQAAVTTITEAPDGAMWAGYEDGYLHTFFLSGARNVFALDSLQGAAITSILFVDDQKACITTYGQGLWILHGDKLTRVDHPSLTDLTDIYHASIDDQGRIWMATDNGIALYHDKKSTTVTTLGRENGLPDEIVIFLTSSTDGDIWMGLYDHGLARYMMNQDTIVGVIPITEELDPVSGLASDPRGGVWFATGNAIYKCSQEGRCQSVTLPSKGIGRIDHIYIDRSSHVWITSGKRVWYANTDIEISLPGIQGVQAVSATTTTLWLGTDHGLYGMNKQDHRLTTYLHNKKINILSLYSDDQGLLWIGTFGQGLYVFNPSTGHVRHLTEADGIANNSILNIDGKAQAVWLATLGGVTEIVWQGDPTHEAMGITDFLEKFNFPATYVYDVHTGHDGRIWFGTDGRGIYYLQHDRLQHFDVMPDTTFFSPELLETIYSITTGEDQSLWISGSGGLVVQLDLKGHIQKAFSSSQATPNSLMRAGKGEILMVTDGVIKSCVSQNYCKVYDEMSGLAGFTPHINATSSDVDGSVWIAGTQQICRYVPNTAVPLHRVALHLQSVLPGHPNAGGIVTLKPGSNFLDIRFNGLWYDDPGRVRYRYLLEGHDQDWIYSREGRVVYSRLSPGTYTFRLESTHQAVFTNQASMEFMVDVLPPLYLRWWFVTAMVALTGMLLTFYIRGRIRRINTMYQLEREKTMLQLHAIQAQVNPHFLFNSFNTLSSIIEEDQEAAVDYLDQLSGFFRGVLMHRHAELIRLDEELDIVRHYTYVLQKRYGDNIRIKEDIQHTSGFIAPLSIQLLVENAIKHNTVSKDKPLQISIAVQGDEVIVSNPVQPKIQPSTESTGFGLSSLLTRYQYLTPRKIEIGHHQNTFTVRIPIIQSDKPI